MPALVLDAMEPAADEPRRPLAGRHAAAQRTTDLPPGQPVNMLDLLAHPRDSPGRCATWPKSARRCWRICGTRRIRVAGARAPVSRRLRSAAAAAGANALQPGWPRPGAGRRTLIPRSANWPSSACSRPLARHLGHHVGLAAGGASVRNNARTGRCCRPRSVDGIRPAGAPDAPAPL